MSPDSTDPVDVAVIGAGSVGIAVAYYLATEQRVSRIALIDARAPMSLTSAQSGENYRNWWPHPIMTAYTDHSTRLMEELDTSSGGRLNMTRGGYALVTRRARPEDLIRDLFRGYADTPEKIRLRETSNADYAPPRRTPWQDAPDGVDVLLDRALIRQAFPRYAEDVECVIHIRRAGSISAQQMGQFMLEQFRAGGGRFVQAEVRDIAAGSPFHLGLSTNAGPAVLRADRIVNAAGPFIGDIAGMLGERLPVQCVYQQKVAFEDRAGAIARDMPFTIDLDGQTLSWSEEDREILASMPETRRFLDPMPGGVHCRPDGPVSGSRIKLGWAYNQSAGDPHDADPVDPQFPDLVLRAASRLHPQLAAYIGRLPRGSHHYGGHYTMTRENWPLIGATNTKGAYIAGALSGFGSMAACATGSLCAAWVTDRPVPDYARSLTLDRYENHALMKQLRQLGTGSL